MSEPTPYRWPQPEVPPTQTQHPWRATVRTVAAGIVAAVPVAADVILGLGLDKTALGGTTLATLAGVTRVLAMPKVNDWLSDFLPFLAAKPRA